MVDITGNIYGRLKVRKMLPRYKQNSRGSWNTYCLCDCSCGNKNVIVNASKLKSNHTKSCGCLQKEMVAKSTKERSTTHGKSNTKAYQIWRAMRNRCNLKTDLAYRYYGGRGIKVCTDWDDDFITFYKWLCAQGYSENEHERNTKYTVDRIDVNCDYEPSNCRVVSMTTQANNTHKNRFETYNGETHTIAEWARIKGMNYKSFCSRLYRGWSFEEAMTV